MKYFVCSDIHSYFEPFIEALNQQGFDKDNPNHTLIVCGDLFDRGPDTIKLMEFINDLPRKILIWGNHEQLMADVLYSHKITEVDISNGTFRSLEDLLEYHNEIKEGSWHRTVETLYKFWQQFYDYYETKNYIFVHSWIPMNGNISRWEYTDDWRTGDWGKAVWQDPFKMAIKGMNKTGKVIVFGHWHCSAGWYYDDWKNRREFGENSCFEPYYNGKQGIIAIDACTAYTNKVNVIVIEDEEVNE